MSCINTTDFLLSIVGQYQVIDMTHSGKKKGKPTTPFFLVIDRLKFKKILTITST